jgi:hypothetical protein
MEASTASSGRLYWLLVAVLLPALNWWVGLWIVVLAREMTPLLLVMPLLLVAESLAVCGRQRSGHGRPGRLGTAGLLLVTTFAWSVALTLVVFALQKSAFTF